jgi:hypothetical protein
MEVAMESQVTLKVRVREKTSVLSFRVTESQAKELEAVCRKEGLDAAQLLQAFYDAGMEDYRKNGLQKVGVRDP